MINVLSFEDAVNILKKRLPEDFIYMNKMDAPLCEAVYGPLSSTTSVYAVWTKPSKQLNKFSRFDLVVDRCYLRYKMYFRDIIDKPVKSRMLKIQLIEITVDDFINFVTKQIEIANE